MNSGSKTAVFVIDDHELIRRGLRDLIDKTDDLHVCGEAGSIAETLQRLDRLAPPDMVVVDLSLPDGNGVELIKRLRARHPALRILVYSMYDEELFAERALLAGALGFIGKQQSSRRLLDAIRGVAAGKTCLSEKLRQRIGSKATGRGNRDPGRSPIDRLSDRELEIFELIGRGSTTRQIAEALHLSVKTVESHRTHIKNKLKLESGTALTHCAVQWTLEQLAAGHGEIGVDQTA